MYFLVVWQRWNVNWLKWVITWYELWNDRRYCKWYITRWVNVEIRTWNMIYVLWVDYKEYWCIYWAIFMWYYMFHILFTYPLCTYLFALDCEIEIRQKYWYLGLRFLSIVVIVEVTFSEYDWDIDIWNRDIYRWGTQQRSLSACQDLFRWIHGPHKTLVSSGLSWSVNVYHRSDMYSRLCVTASHHFAPHSWLDYKWNVELIIDIYIRMSWTATLIDHDFLKLWN